MGSSLEGAWASPHYGGEVWVSEEELSQGYKAWVPEATMSGRQKMRPRGAWRGGARSARY